MTLGHLPRNWVKSDAQIISLPHVLIIYNNYGHSHRDLKRSMVAIKFRDSCETWKNRKFSTMDITGHRIQGHRVFLFMRYGTYALLERGTPVDYIDTLSKQTKLCNYPDPHKPCSLYVNWKFGMMPLVCHDGLFHQFDKGDYTVTQVSLHATTVIQEIPDALEMNHGLNCWPMTKSQVEKPQPELDNHRFVALSCNRRWCPRAIVDLATGRCTIGESSDGVTTVVTTASLSALLEQQHRYVFGFSPGVEFNSVAPPTETQERQDEPRPLLPLEETPVQR